jgi:hypothetical protein
LFRSLQDPSVFPGLFGTIRQTQGRLEVEPFRGTIHKTRSKTAAGNPDERAACMELQLLHAAAFFAPKCRPSITPVTSYGEGSKALIDCLGAKGKSNTFVPLRREFQ